MPGGVVHVPRELARARDLSEVVNEILMALEPRIVVGTTTRELDRFVGELLSERRLESAFRGEVPQHILARVNRNGSGAPDTRPLRDGDLLGLGVGARTKAFCAYQSWTYAVGKLGAGEQHLLETALTALRAAVDLARDGQPVVAISRAIQETVEGAGHVVDREWVGHGIGISRLEPPAIPCHVAPDAPHVLLRSGNVLSIHVVARSGQRRSLRERLRGREHSVDLSHMVIVTPEGPDVTTEERPQAGRDAGSRRAPPRGQRLAEIVEAFLRSEGGSPAAETAVEQIKARMRGASRTDLETSAELLAGNLDSWPDPQSGQIALLLGFAVESGAKPLPLAQRLLARAVLTARGALRFVEALRAAVPADPEDEALRTASLSISERMPDAAAAVTAFPGTALAAVALLSRSPEARALARGTALPELGRSLANGPGAPGSASFLSRVLDVLDGEELLVLHPETGRGFDVRITGVADNVQLHLLLAATLVSRGLPGGVLPDDVIACLRGDGPAALHVPSHGVFELHPWTALGPDGEVSTSGGEGQEHSVRDEGKPADILAFEDRRVVVLAPPAYGVAWNTARIVPGMRAEVSVIRELDQNAVRGWLTRLGRSPRPTSPAR
jgi:methionine aminopeptidase